MSMYCLPTNNNLAPCQADAAVAILKKMFGSDFIGNFIAGTSPSASIADAGTLMPTLMGGIATVAMVVGGFLFTTILFTALLNSAQDGEAFGKGGGKVHIVMRFLFSVVMLIPTPSGYSVIQVFLMFFALWSNGQTNKLYANVTSTALKSSTSFTSNTNDGKSDPWGILPFARTYVRDIHCMNTLNQVYYNNQPTVNWVTQNTLNDGAGTTTYSSLITDTTNTLSTPNQAICGTFTRTVIDYSAKSNFQKTQNGTNTYSILNSAAENQLIYSSIANYQQAIETNKDSVFTNLMSDLNPTILLLPTDPVNQADYAQKWQQAQQPFITQFNAAVQTAITNSGNPASDQGLSTNLHNLANDLIDKGWTYSSSMRQAVSSIRYQIQQADLTPTWTITPPALNMSLLGDEDKTTEVSRSIVDNMDTLFVNPKYPVITTPATATANPSQSSDDITNNLDASHLDLNALTSKVDTVYGQSIARLARYATMYILTGTSSTTGANPLLVDDSNIDVLSNIERTGEYILLVRSQLLTDESLFYTAVDSLFGGLSIIPIEGTGLGEAGMFLNHWFENVVVKPIAPLLAMLLAVGEYMAVVIPSMPAFFFITAVVAWYIHIIQAMAGLPLWAVMHMIPERNFVGSQTQGYVTIVGLFLRPILTLVGLWVGFILANPILMFVTDNFFGNYASMTASQSGAGLITFIRQALTFVGWMTIYCTLVSSICYMIFGLAGTLPNSVLAWIGSGLNSGDWGVSNAKEALGGGNKALGQQSQARNAAKGKGKGPDGNGGNTPRGGGDTPNGNGGGSSGGNSNNPNSPVSPTNTDEKKSASPTAGASQNQTPTAPSNSASTQTFGKTGLADGQAQSTGNDAPNDNSAATSASVNSSLMNENGSAKSAFQMANESKSNGGKVNFNAMSMRMGVAGFAGAISAMGKSMGAGAGFKDTMKSAGSGFTTSANREGQKYVLRHGFNANDKKDKAGNVVEKRAMAAQNQKESLQTVNNMSALNLDFKNKQAEAKANGLNGNDASTPAMNNAGGSIVPTTKGSAAGSPAMSNSQTAVNEGGISPQASSAQSNSDATSAMNNSQSSATGVQGANGGIGGMPAQGQSKQGDGSSTSAMNNSQSSATDVQGANGSVGGIPPQPTSTPSNTTAATNTTPGGSGSSLKGAEPPQPNTQDLPNSPKDSPDKNV